MTRSVWTERSQPATRRFWSAVGATALSVRASPPRSRPQPGVCNASAQRDDGLRRARWEREGMIAMFLDKMDLSPIGLDAPPFEADASSGANLAFSTRLANYGVVVPFQLGAAGVWWAVADTLCQLQVGQRIFGRPENLDGFSVGLRIYEVSSCDPAKGDCAPGYGNDVGTGQVLRPGTDPQLQFQLTLLYEGHDFADQVFNLPYDAIGWTESMDHLALVINDLG